jgi:ribonuclease HI
VTKKQALYLKIDGSYNIKREQAYGGRAIYYKKQLIEATPFVIKGYSSMEAEYKAVIHSLEHIDRNLPRILTKTEEGTGVGNLEVIRVYTDNLVVIKHLTGKSLNNTSILRKLCKDIKEVIKSIEEKYEVAVEMYWVPRKCNLLADTLCKYAQCFQSQTLKLLTN